MKALLIEDHALIREAMHRALVELEPGVIVLEAQDSHQASAIVAENNDLDLILLDLGLPDRDGFDLLGELRAQYPAIAVVVLSAFDQPSKIKQALDMGALGFIPKAASRDVTLSALKLVQSGGIYVPPQVLRYEPTAPMAITKADVVPTKSPADFGLTARQLDVLALMVQGNSNKVIGKVLGLAVPTVKRHVYDIMQALKVTNRTEAVIAVGRLGWVLPTPKA